MKTLLLSIAAATAASTFSLLPSYADAQTGIITAQRPWEAKLKAHASLKDGTKRCLFLHGVGEDTDGPTTSTYEDYWGKVHEHTPQCGERVFWHRDTSNMAFNDPRLVNYYCSLIKAPSGVVNGTSGAGGAVENTLVFSHSMANLVVAYAIKTGACGAGVDLSNTTSAWYSLGAPMSGAKSANWIDDICATPGQFGVLGPVLSGLADKLHYCSDNKTITNPVTPSPGAKSSKSLRGTARKAKSENALAAYQSMASGYPLLEGLDVILHDRAAGLMCGTSSWGLLSVWSAELSALAAAVSYGEDNDGAVGIDSCEGLLKDKMQDKAATLPFYRAKINHFDEPCLNGNGDIAKADRSPCTWFEHRKGPEYEHALAQMASEVSAEAMASKARLQVLQATGGENRDRDVDRAEVA